MSNDDLDQCRQWLAAEDAANAYCHDRYKTQTGSETATEWVRTLLREIDDLHLEMKANDS